MAKVPVDVPGLTAVGNKAGGYPKIAKNKVDGASAGVSSRSGLGSATTLAKVGDVWTGHLREFHTDLDIVGGNLRATAHTMRYSTWATRCGDMSVTARARSPSSAFVATNPMEPTPVFARLLRS